MKFATIMVQGAPRFAVDLPEHQWSLLHCDLAEAHELRVSGRPLPKGEKVAAEAITFLAPCRPSKIVCVEWNYQHHAVEMGKVVPSEPVLYIKPPSSVIGPGDTIVLPSVAERVDHEAGLAAVIGRRARHLAPENAPEHIFGYTCINDITARDIQRRERRQGRAKGFDTFAPLGPVIATDIDPRQTTVTLRVGSEVRQHCRCNDMLWSVPQLVAFASSVMTLEPGDIVSTGTPHGVGPLHHGDQVDVEIDGIGVLRNEVCAERMLQVQVTSL